MCLLSRKTTKGGTDMLDAFLFYLIAVNAAAFLAFTVDYFICTRNPRLDGAAAKTLALSVLPVAGGGVGTLLALLAFAGRGRAHRMNKDNIAWWFITAACLVAWGLALAVRYGLVTLDASVAGIFAGWDLARLKVLGIYLAVVNAVTLVAFAWDKHVAASGNDLGRRVPEARLLGFCLAGGSVGGLLAMRLARHKTKKWYFVWGLPVFMVLHVALILCAHMGGLI